MTASSTSSSHSVRMLSPPYSPHADGGEEHACLGQVPQKKALPSSLTQSLNKLDTMLGEDELTDNDDDEFEDEDSSGSVPPEDFSRFGQKRKAMQAFLRVDDRNVDDDDTETAINDDNSDLESLSGRSDSASSVSSLSTASGLGERRMTTCWDALKTNPAKYLRQERSLLDLYPLRRHSWAGPGSISFGSDDEIGSGSSAALAASAVASVSSRQASSRGRGRKAAGSASSAGNTSSFINKGRKRASLTEIEGDGSSASDLVDEEGSPKSQGNTGVRVHDLSLSQIKDYSPSLKKLPPGKSLRAEWKGAPMDLSGDPDLHLLHPAEAHLASVLRLPCDVYLDSKRRLFAEKVHRLRQNLPFRRTDSQKACRIDVNKASRLFGAFEKIGWLEDELFLHFLE